MTARSLTPTVAFAVAAAGIALFTVMDAFMKSLTLAIGVYNAMVWRTGISTALGGALWLARGGTRPSRRALRLHLLRGTVVVAMGVLWFWGLARVPMAQAISLSYIAPLLALLLGAAFLGERVGTRVVGASFAALAGVAEIVAGQRSAALGDEALLGAGAILASALLYAGNLVIARVQSQAASASEIAFFQYGLVTLFLLLAAPWLLAVPPVALWWQVAAAAALATASLFLLAVAYAHGAAGFLATSEYTSFVWAAALGWLVFGERLLSTTVAGAAVIAAACLYGARSRQRAPAAVEAGA